ncbi:MAG: 23S rRNA (adenine(2503)-C(2))-methyltransferase RlmN [Actinobacteria bacterium]|nr:23S rRNA (adenine(2503)-C(2))-methyltransferase RlmN [Actinomycetota bacterium]
MTTRYELSRKELTELLDGEPKYRVDQVWDGLYSQCKEPQEITNVPKQLRVAFSELLPAALTLVRETEADNGATVKQLWSLPDGLLVESVLMHYRHRSTVCVSSQAGCAMGCSFCATGQVGFDRNLTTGEIVEQVIRSSQRAGDKRIDNIVFMGMGEPLANFESVWNAVTRINSDMGIGARHITMSTVGVVPGIKRLANEDLPINLAVSLHSANDQTRNKIAPINKTYPLRELADALQFYMRQKTRRISFEWAMIEGINDSDTDAKQLASYSLPLRAHVNLIPLNSTPGYQTKGTDPKRILEFRDLLDSLGVNATVRNTRGSDIDAACGQLRAEQQVVLKTRRSAKSS